MFKYHASSPATRCDTNLSQPPAERMVKYTVAVVLALLSFQVFFKAVFSYSSSQGNLRSDFKLPSCSKTETNPSSSTSATQYSVLTTLGTCTVDEAGQLYSYFLLVKISVPMIVVLTPPLLVLLVVDYETEQGKPLIMQQSPFLIDPAWTGVYSPGDQFWSVIVEIINYYIDNSFIYTEKKIVQENDKKLQNYDILFLSFLISFVSLYILFTLQIQMQSSESKYRLQLTKQWFFEFFHTLDTNQFTNIYAKLFIILMELTAIHYFYIHPAFTSLNNHAIFSNYFKSNRQYLVHICPFGSALLNIFCLALYPLIIALTIFIMKLGPNKILLAIVQISVFLYPLLWIKVAIELVTALSRGVYLYLVIPLGVINVAFGCVLLMLIGRKTRIMELPLVFLLQLRANTYFIMVVLLGRLLLLGYMLPNRHSLGFFFEAALMAILVISPFCDDQLLNNIGFLSILLTSLAIGARQTKKSIYTSLSILDFVDKVQEQDEVMAEFEVYRKVEQHHVECQLLDCLCRQFYEVKPAELVEWVYKFQEQRLRRGESFEGRLEYAERCQSHYDYKLSGLVRVCDGRPKNIIEEYQVYKACSVYEHNLRKQDKNYRYGEPFKNAQEELQSFHSQLANILAQIRKFWSLITSFDGSTKFLNEILLISHAITTLKRSYRNFTDKYDEQLKQFTYGYELFLSIILNEDIAEEDDVLVPDPCAFIITNDQTILNANNAFLVLTSQTKDNIMGHPYTCFIPDVYREIHKTWAADFVEMVEKWEGKTIAKCLSIASMEIKIVEMEHRVLPRFLDGLEIFTSIHHMNDNRKDKRQSFIFLVEKQTYFIKNVESSFFDTVKFKVNQRNFKLLQEMSLTSLFENFNTNLSQNPNRQVTIFPHFLEEFTFMKTKRKTTKDKTSITGKIQARASNITGQNIKVLVAEIQQFFQFQILQGSRPEDPYLKVRFTLKEDRPESVESSQQSLSKVEPEQLSPRQKPKKQENFDFAIPYFLLVALGICHIFYFLGRNQFDSAMRQIHSRYQFYLDYDYTTLHILNAFTGKDYTDQLRILWMNGYGDFSESFNAFRRVGDPLFMTYFQESVTVEFHNSLFQQIHQAITKQTSTIQSYQILVMVTLIIAISCQSIGLLLTLRYTLFIEGKVGALLLQFVIIQSSDVKEIIAMIQSFESTVLNAQQNTAVYRVPIEVGEDSAFELMKGGGYSLNSSMVAPEQDLQETPKELNNGKKKRSSTFERERVSLSLMKKELKQSSGKSKFKKDSTAISEQKSLKNRNINLFKQQYRSCKFIIGANKKLFLLIFAGFIISITVLCVSFLLLYSPFNVLPLHLQTLDNLQQARIILLKSQTEILINKTSLLPSDSLSNTLLSIISLNNRLSSSSTMSSFSSKFTSFMNSNVCGLSGYNCSLLSSDNNLYEYGIKVISQYIESYFRQRNATALTTNTLQNQFIIYTQLLFTDLVKEFIQTSQRYCSVIDQSQLKMLIIGSIGLLLGMVLVHYSLTEFKDRIENSRNLLQIIPKEIKRKQEKELQELTLKEIYTP